METTGEVVPDDLRRRRTDGSDWCCKLPKEENRPYCYHHSRSKKKRLQKIPQETSESLYGDEEDAEEKDEEETQSKKLRQSEEVEKKSEAEVCGKKAEEEETPKKEEVKQIQKSDAAASKEIGQGEKMRGDAVRFWTDRWCGEKSLREEFPTLYDVSNNQKGSVHSHIRRDGENSSWDLGFRRRLKDWEVELVPSLLERIGDPSRYGANKDMYFCIPHQPKPNPKLEAANCTEGCRSSKRALTDPDKTKSRAIQQAQKVQANLDRAFPSFVKSVHLSHVSGVYILGIPKLFCKDFLPEKNAIITLINENQEEYQVEYNRRKFKVHTGWKEFSIAHKLVEGDGLVFQLVKPTILKVYIARLNSSQTKDEVISVQNVDAPQEKNKSGTRTKTRDKTVKKHQKTVQLAALMQPEVKPDCSYEEAGSDVLGSMKSSTVDIKTIKSMENFSIVVNGVTMDSEFSEQARQKYYELCCSQNSVLHEKLLDTINFQMAVGIISQTIEVADKIRSCTRTTSLDEFTKWNINLGAFEQLGMNVGFLRDRIKQLVSLVCKVEEGVDSKDRGEVIDGRDDVMQEMERLKAKLDDIIQEIQRLKAKRDELRVNSEMFDSEINTLEVKAKYYELKFQGEVDAPW